MSTNAVATAPVADLNKMNVNDLRDYLNGLRSQELEIENDKELAANQKQQAAVVAKIRELKANRAGELTKIAEVIKAQGFTVQELFADEAFSYFSDDEIAAEAKARGLTTGKTVKAATGESKTRKAPESREYASSKNPVFLVAPRIDSDHHKTIDTVLHQGRVNENPFAVSTPLLRAAGKDEKATIANLLKLVKPESADYAKSEAGQAELAKLAKFIVKAKEKADKDAAEKAKAPAAA
jgi:predicted XRE-type DNA-binding protein